MFQAVKHGFRKSEYCMIIQKQISDGVTNVPKYDVRNFCREVELYKYHAKYSCAVNLTEHRNSSKELCR